MPKKKHENQPSDYAHFQEANKYLKRNYILFAPVGEEMSLIVPEKAKTGALGLFGEATLAEAQAAHSVKFTKVAVPNTNLAIVNEDNEYSAAVWTTTPEKIKAAIFSGAFKPDAFQNPLTKVIAQIGNYKRTVFLDRYIEEEKLTTTKTAAKLDIAENIQKAVDELQSLYLSINRYDDGELPEKNLVNLFAKVQKFRGELAEIKDNCNNPTLKTGFENILKNVQIYEDALRDRQYRAISRDKMKIILRPYNTSLKGLANSSKDLNLQHFIENSVNDIVQLGIDANFNISPWELAAPGSLADDLLQAKATSEDLTSVRVDYHNPYAPEHAGDFSRRVNKDGKVALNLKELGVAPESIQDLARTVALIDGVDKGIDLSDGRLPGRGGVRWEIRKWTDPFAALGRWLTNAVFNTLGLFSGYFLELKRDLAKKTYAELEVTQPLFDPYYPLTKLTQTSVIGRAARFIGAQLYRVTLEPLMLLAKATWEGLFKLKILDELRFDRTIGRKKLSSSDAGFLLETRLSEDAAQEEINEFRKERLLQQYHEHQVELMKAQNQIYDKGAPNYAAMAAKFREQQLVMPGAAIMPYHVRPDDPNDMISGAGNGINVLFDVFSQEIYRGNPLAGFAFTLGAATAAPIAAPSLMQIAMFKYLATNVSQPVAQAVLGHSDGIMAATSVGLVLGKLSFLAVNVGTHGKESLLMKGLSLALQNPVVAGVVGVAAYYIGYEVAFNLHIPMISPGLADESQGELSFIELSLSGAKMVALVAESLVDTSHTIEEAIDVSVNNPELFGFITNHLTTIYRVNNEIPRDAVLTAEQQDQIQANVKNFQEQLKWNFKQPNIADKVFEYAGLLKKAAANASIAGVAAIPVQPKDDEIKVFLERARIRDQIKNANPATLSAKDKYKIMHYVENEYKDQPEYVAAVKNKLSQQEKLGPLAESLRIALSYPMALVRAINAVGSYGFARLTGDKDSADIRLQPARHFASKVWNDLGLVVKSGVRVARALTKFAGAVLIAPLTIVGGTLASIGSLVSKNRGFKYNATWSFFSKAFFSPGKLSQQIDSLVGQMRAGSSGMNLNIATDKINITDNLAFNANPTDYANKYIESKKTREQQRDEKRDPQSEIVYAYADFSRLSFVPVKYRLPSELQVLNTKLHDARTALNAFGRTDFKSDPVEKKLEVALKLFKLHDCLTLRSSLAIAKLNEYIHAPNNDVMKQQAKIMLECYEELHKAALSVSHRLAVYPDIIKEIVRLPEPPTSENCINKKLIQNNGHDHKQPAPTVTPTSTSVPTKTKPAKEVIPVNTKDTFTEADEAMMLNVYKGYLMRSGNSARYQPVVETNSEKNEVTTRLKFKSKADAEEYMRMIQSRKEFAGKFEFALSTSTSKGNDETRHMSPKKH